MAGIFAFVAIALGGIALLFKSSRDQLYYGTSWAVEVCATSKMFCTHPEYLAYAGGGLLLLAISVGLGRVLNGD